MVLHADIVAAQEKLSANSVAVRMESRVLFVMARENKIAQKSSIGGKADEKGVEESSQCPADIGTDIRCPAGDERVGRG